MAVDVDSQDGDLIDDSDIEGNDDEATPKLSPKEANAQTLEMRRKLEDRLEKRRIKDSLGFDDYEDIDF